LRKSLFAGPLVKEFLPRLLVLHPRLGRKESVERLPGLFLGRVESLLYVLLLGVAELVRVVEDRVRALGRREPGQEKGEGQRRREGGQERRRS
jgi:hypothetical protein